MEARLKAEELVLKYLRIDNNTKEWFNKNMAKQCALIAVNEIIESRKADPDFDDTKLGIVTHYIAPHPLRLSYWTKVKEEIEKL